MFVLGIVCSPRENSNAEIMVKEALKRMQENDADVELVKTREMEISPCEGFESCHNTSAYTYSECIFKDFKVLRYIAN